MNKLIFLLAPVLFGQGFTVGTWYMPPGGGLGPSASEATVQSAAPVAGTISKFTATLSAAPGAGNTITFTWRKAGADQALTCAITGASAKTCSDTTHNFTIAAADLVDVKAVVAGGTVTASVVLQWATPGVAGPTGAQGAKGDAGSNGTNGTNGTNGADGAAGADGANGAIAQVQINGTDQTVRGKINFLDGTNTTAHATDNAGAGSTDVHYDSTGGGASDPCAATVTSTYVLTLFANASSTNRCNLGSVPLPVTAPKTITTSGTSASDVTEVWFDPVAQVPVLGYDTATTYTWSALGQLQSGVTAYPDCVIHMFTIPTTANAWGTPVRDMSSSGSTGCIGVGVGLSPTYDPTQGIQTITPDYSKLAGRSNQVTFTDASAVTWAIGTNASIASATWQFTAHSGSRTLNVTGMAAPGYYTVDLIQDGTGGEGLTLGTGCTWKVNGGGSGAVTLSTGAGVRDVLAWKYDGTNCDATLGKNYN